jgi:bifunctional UDP-N-acetylglucosamine pyrophosphorylase/glucosamine-1-phosphate N-acetyltransferase
MKAIILAAGQGKRMRSSLQKNLHPICGKPMIAYIAEACRNAGIDEQDITVVVSPGSGEEIKRALPGLGVRFAVQEIPLGTGHAAQAAFLGEGEAYFSDGDDILVLAGDMPLLTAEFIKDMAGYYRTARAGGAYGVVAAVYLPENKDFGRVFFDQSGDFTEIIEARDLTPNHPPSDWRGTSCYLFNGAALRYGLSRMTNNNAQKEFYLTDVPQHIKNNGQGIKVFRCTDDSTIFTGINTQEQLAEAASHMRRRINARHLDNGVRMPDPVAVYIDSAVEIAAETVIYPGAILEGACKIEEGVFIGPGVHLKDTHIGQNAKILSYSVLTQARVGADTSVGPFAYLRPGADIGRRCRIGNFVEIKKAAIGDDTNAAHLTYIGDATVGSNVNIGCGVITANYDGVTKSHTVMTMPLSAAT